MYHKSIDKIVIVTNDQGISIEMSIFAHDGVRLFHCRDAYGIERSEFVQAICMFYSHVFTDFHRTSLTPNTVTLYRISTSNEISDNE